MLPFPHTRALCFALLSQHIPCTPYYLNTVRTSIQEAELLRQKSRAAAAAAKFQRGNEAMTEMLRRLEVGQSRQAMEEAYQQEQRLKQQLQAAEQQARRVSNGRLFRREGTCPLPISCEPSGVG